MQQRLAISGGQLAALTYKVSPDKDSTTNFGQAVISAQTAVNELRLIAPADVLVKASSRL
jgi:hypothetical protein